MAFNEVEQRDLVQTGLSNYSRGSQPNQSLGVLFEGLGTAVTAGLRSNEEAITTQVSMDAAKEAEAAANETMPPAIDEFKGDIEALVSAKGQNALSDTAYETKKIEKIKRMKARFPQYADMIDKAWSAAEGSSSANDLRRSRQSDLQRLYAEEKAKTSKEADEIEKKYNERRMFSDANADILGSPEFGYQYEKLTGRKYVPGSMDYDEVAARGIVYQERSTTYKLDAAQKRAQMNKEEALPYATQKVNAIVRKHFSTIGNSQLGDFLKKVEAAQASGDGIDAEEDKQLRLGWSVLRASAEDTIKNALRDPNDPALQYLTPDQLKGVEDGALSIYSTYEKMFNDKDFGMLNAATNELTQNKAHITNKILKSNPALEVYNAYSGLLPPEILLSIFTDANQKFVSDSLLKDFTDATTAAILTRKGSFKDSRNAIEEQRDSTQAGVALGEQVNRIHKILTAPNVSPDAVVSIAKNIYRKENQDVINMLKYSERTAMFRKLVSPSVVKAIIDSGDTTALNQLVDFTTNQFDALTKHARDTVIDTQVNTNSLNIEFDGTHFKPVMDKGQYYKDLTSTVLGPLNNANELLMYRQAATATAELNQYLDLMTPLWQATGQDPNTVLSNLMQGQSLTGQVKQGSFFTKMSKAIADWATREEEKKQGESMVQPTSKTIKEVGKRLKPAALDLIPEMHAPLEKLIQNLAAKGVDVEIVQGNRTVAEQNALYAQGRTKPGAIVTNAKGGQSNHNHSRAVDIVPTALKGVKNWDPENPLWDIIGEEARALGFEWGGDWKKKDRPHVQWMKK